jgi:acetyl esterase/lipase
MVIRLAHDGLADELAAGTAFQLKANVLCAQRGEQELKVDIYMSQKDGKRPGVLVVHGGAWRYGDRRQLRHYCRQLAQRGYVAYAVDYRLAPEHKFPAQMEDCRDAVRWIRTHESCWGRSIAGGGLEILRSISAT